MANSQQPSATTKRQLSASEELFSDARMPLDKASFNACLMLQKALRHHHGERQDEVYSHPWSERSPQVRAHWSAAKILKRALQRVLREYIRRNKAEMAALDKKWDREGERERRRLAALVKSTVKTAESGRRLVLKADGDRLLIAVGRRTLVYQCEGLKS